MRYTGRYASALGAILLTADEKGLTGLWFEGQRYFPGWEGFREEPIPVLVQAKAWLEEYFAGQKPDFSVPLHPEGTDFQKEVWQYLLTIPYGKTVTYGDIAGVLSGRRGGAPVAARAVGAAVGRNPIAILVPCHRVVGKNGSLTGYAGGLDRKRALLELEKV